MYRVRRFLTCGLLCLVLVGVLSCGGSTTTTVPPSTIPVTLSTLVLTPASVNGGQTSMATVTLNEVAPTGGVQVVLSTSNNSITLPTTLVLMIPAGQMSGTFKIETLPVGSNQTAQISVTYLTFTTLSATLTVLSQKPLSVTGFTVNPSNTISGQTLTGSIALDAPAFSPGQQVFVTTSDISVVQPQNPVTVQTSLKTANFSIFTSPVTSTRTVTVSASLNTTTVSVTLTLQPAGTAVTSLNVVPFTVAGGTNMTGTVTVTPPAPPGGESVGLSAAFTNTATAPNTPLPIAVPAMVTVAPGATQAQFTITSIKVTKTTDVTITATLNTTQFNFVVEIVPSLSLAGLNCLQAAVTVGNSVTCDVSLSIPAPAGGQAVQLTSNNATALPVPASVTVPAGSSTQSFSLVGGAVTSPTQVTLTANLSGSSSTTGAVTTIVSVVPVTALVPTAFNLNATTVLGGASGNLTGSVTIAAAAPPGGLAIALSSSDPSVQFPNGPAVTVPQNQTTATFPITTSAVAAPVQVTLTATVNTVSLTANLTVVPPPTVLSLSINPASVVGSSTAVGTVTLQSPAPQNGAVVTIQSSSSFAQAAPSVTVPQGATSASFAITTLPVPGLQTVTITALIGASSQQAMLTILPPVADVRLIYFNPSTVRTGGSSTGTVVLTGPAQAGGTTVMLTSGQTAVTVQGSVTVPANATSATFVATAATGVTTATQVQVTATLTATVTNTLNVIPAQTTTLSEQLVLSGETNSTDFPLVSAVQGSLGTGNDTGFVTSVTQTTPVGGATASAAAFSTYLGGMSSFGQVRDAFVDSSGNVFVCGVTVDPNLGAMQKDPVQAGYGGGKDAFVAEFSKAGALLFFSYFGGSGDETCYSVTVDSASNVYIIGSTTNTGAMGLAGTSGAFQTANAGGNDFFVAKFNPAAASMSGRLLWITLVGGTGDDFANGRIRISPSGAIVLTGQTSSTTPPPTGVLFPIPAGQGVPNLTGVGTAGVIINLTPDGTRLLSSTLLFGRTNGASIGSPTKTTVSGLAIDSATGEIFVCGQTDASDLQTSLGVSQNTIQSALKGAQDAYVATLGANGTIGGVTYLGGSSTSTVQACKGIAADSDLNPIVAVQTDAADYPITSTIGAAKAGQGTHMAVTKLTADLSTAIFSTLIGGSGAETADATRVELDAAENVYFSLSTTSTDFPVTSNALFGAFKGTTQNTAFVKLTSDGSMLSYSSLLGGSANNSTTSLFYLLN
jgi:hypothetical protein